MSITEGYSQPCTASTGGLVNLWLTDKDNVTSFTLSGSEYNAVTMNASAVFYKYEFEQDTGGLRQNGTRESRSSIVTHEVEFYMTKLSTTQRDALQAIIDSSICGLIAIAEDANGQKWVLGYSENFGTARPLKFASSEGATGVAFSEDNGTTVMLSSSDNELARIFTGVVPV